MRFSNLLFTFLALVVLLISACSDPTLEPPVRDSNSKKQVIKDSTPSESDLQAAQDTTELEQIIQRDDSPDRGSWQKPSVVIEKMGDLSNKTVADIGFGSGFFSRRLAQKAKKVIAIELDPRLISYMDSIIVLELSEEFQERIETRLATPTDSKLTVEEADIILLVNTYPWLVDRINYLKQLRQKLIPKGEIIIVDFKKKRIPRNKSFPETRYRVPLFEVENELEAAGFSTIKSDDLSLDYQYIVVASN